MSCITEILKLKGDQEVMLPLGEDGTPWVAVEGGGTYKGLEYLIVLNTTGHRCGYVAIPPDHKFSNTPLEIRKIEFEKFKKEYEHYDYDNLNIECHGGLTFMAKDHGLKDLLSTPCNDFWIGFDCGHCWDKPDQNAFIKYYGEDEYKKRQSFFDVIGSHGESVKYYEYVEQECHSIIDQLLAA